MAKEINRYRIGLYGPDLHAGKRHNCGLWGAGIAESIKVSEADMVQLPESSELSWGEILENVHGVVVVGHDSHPRRNVTDGEALVSWCHDHNVPILAIDHGLHMLNTAHGGTIYNDLSRDQPEALQHRHPPERGLRHAINVIEDSYLATLYGEGEVVVNSEHRKALARVARCFRVCAHALDGVIEAVETPKDDAWWALGVQWNPSSPTGSGLDIQLFRGLVTACGKRWGAKIKEAACALA
jgi:gamma-glutamyl-gamma-aminobutyrate hydrolase PuuD